MIKFYCFCKAFFSRYYLIRIKTSGWKHGSWHTVQVSMQSTFNSKSNFMQVVICPQHLLSTPTLVLHILNAMFRIFGVGLLFWGYRGRIRRLQTALWHTTDLSGCGWPPLGKSGLRSGASDLLQALACLADELQAAQAPCGDWLRPICSLPLKRTGLMC